MKLKANVLASLALLSTSALVFAACPQPKAYTLFTGNTSGSNCFINFWQQHACHDDDLVENGGCVGSGNPYACLTGQQTWTRNLYAPNDPTDCAGGCSIVGTATDVTLYYGQDDPAHLCNVGG